MLKFPKKPNYNLWGILAIVGGVALAGLKIWTDKNESNSTT